MARPRAGAPSKYKPEYGPMLVDGARKGQTISMFCDSIDIHKDTLYEWVKVHKEFSDHWKRARQANEAWFEKLGLQGMAGKLKGFSAATFIFWMKAKHGWRDDQVVFEEESDLEFI